MSLPITFLLQIFPLIQTPNTFFSIKKNGKFLRQLSEPFQAKKLPCFGGLCSLSLRNKADP